jgi:DNA-binding CsgD family transcriptional regulator
MSKETTVDPRSERMLELLSKGASSRELAEKLGYQEGTMRVYLHHLYKKIGVANKTEAVIWWLKRTAAAPAPAAEQPTVAVPIVDDLFGEMALKEGLYAALGVMSAFIGPYSRQWELARRLEGAEEDAETQARRDRSRGLFRALLQGDWAYGKRFYDHDGAAGLLVDATSDATLLAALLALGGYSNAADRLQGQLTPRRKAAGTSHREVAMIRALAGALDGSAQALSELHEAAAERSAPAGVKQVATVLLFHAHAALKDRERARKAANALWAEAEGVKQQLVAMGDRPLGSSRASTPAGRGAARRAGVREKVTAR